MSTLQKFVSDYIETIGGDYDEVEPMVYDVLLPDSGTADDDKNSMPLREFVNRGIFRITYDPEAVPEHPGSQLVSFGTPFVDSLLKDAVQRGRISVVYRTGLPYEFLNVQARDIPAKVNRTIKLPDGFTWLFENGRWLHYPQAVFWFEATFAGDLKEQEMIPVGFDMASMREVRRLDQLLDFEHLDCHPAQQLIETKHNSITDVYLKARQEAVRTVSALGNIRRRELESRLEKQVRRMQLYYSDLRKELAEQAHRTAGRSGKTQTESSETANTETKWAKRLETINREELQRITELRQKSMLKVQIRLANLLVIHQPKILVRASVIEKNSTESGRIPMELVWNPLTEQLEAATCPVCGCSTFEFHRMTKKMKMPLTMACDRCVGEN